MQRFSEQIFKEHYPFTANTRDRLSRIQTTRERRQRHENPSLIKFDFSVSRLDIIIGRSYLVLAGVLFLLIGPLFDFNAINSKTEWREALWRRSKY